MANVTPGYVFLGATDPITYTKLNLLGTPTITIGSGEVTVAMLAPLTSAGRLLGSSPTSAAATTMLINSSGATLHSGTGLTFGSITTDSSIAIGKSSTAKVILKFNFASVENTATASLFGNFGDSNNVGFTLTVNSIASQIAGVGSWAIYSDGTLANFSASALSTSATAGFFHIPSCAGTPTGVPANGGAGKIASIYDTSANKIWFYNGSWRGVVVS